MGPCGRTRSSPSRSRTRRRPRCGRGSSGSGLRGSRRAPSTRRRSRSSAAARGDAPGRILATKALLLRQVGNTLPPPYRFRPAGDLATEVEWAKNRRLTPQTYRDGLGTHEPPIPADLMATVFREYERRKQASGLIDFEDLLELAVRMYEEDEWAVGGAARAVRGLHGGRVPGREPAAAVAARALARAARRPLRGRGRLPVDLRLHRRLAGVAARSCRRATRTRRWCGSRRTTAPRRRCSRSRTGSCRSSAAPRSRCARRGPKARSRSCAASARPRTRAPGSSSGCARCTRRACPTKRWQC